jgi:hypothetical protein
VHCRQELASIEGESAHRVFPHQLVERHPIAPEPLAVQAYLLLAARKQHVSPELAPQNVKRLAQVRARVVLVQLGPEEGG